MTPLALKLAAHRHRFCIDQTIEPRGGGPVAVAISRTGLPSLGRVSVQHPRHLSRTRPVPTTCSGETTMSAEPSYQVPLSGPTHHALQLVARIDQMALDEIVETLVATYLEKRIRSIHEAKATSASVIHLAAWREDRGASSTNSRRSAKIRRRRSASQR
jgi:hypothetical protein